MEDDTSSIVSDTEKRKLYGVDDILTRPFGDKLEDEKTQTQAEKQGIEHVAQVPIVDGISLAVIRPRQQTRLIAALLFTCCIFVICLRSLYSRLAILGHVTVNSSSQHLN